MSTRERTRAWLATATLPLLLALAGGSACETAQAEYGVQVDDDSAADDDDSAGDDDTD